MINRMIILLGLLMLTGCAIVIRGDRHDYIERDVCRYHDGLYKIVDYYPDEHNILYMCKDGTNFNYWVPN